MILMISIMYMEYKGGFYMIRGIKKEQIIKDFLANTNTYEYAKEYGLFEVIDSFLFYRYEGNFTETEVEQIIELLEEVL